MSDSNQPFEDKDILYRYTPPGLGEVVFAKSAPTNVFAVTMYYHVRRHWVCTTPGMRDVTELLRQNAAQAAEIAKLMTLLDDATYWIPPATGREMVQRIREALK